MGLEQAATAKPEATSNSAAEYAADILKALRLLGDRGLTRRAMVLLVADRAKIRGNWTQKKKIVEEIFALAEQVAGDLNLKY